MIHLPAIEALLVLPCCCCCTTPVVPPDTNQGLDPSFFFLMTADPPLFSSCSIFFLLIPCLPVFIFFFTYNPKSWMGSWNLVSLLICKNRYQNSFSSFFTIVTDLFLVRRVVFMLYNYSYLHLDPIFFKCICFCPHIFLIYYFF